MRKWRKGIQLRPAEWENKKCLNAEKAFLSGNVQTQQGETHT